jgi:hypothetical protein
MLRFTIRDVLWLMVVVGLVAGWWIDRQQMGSKVEESAMEQLNSRMRADDLARRLREVDPNWRDYVERPRVTVGMPNKRQ